jgi:hypothetical protein
MKRAIAIMTSLMHDEVRAFVENLAAFLKRAYELGAPALCDLVSC